MPIYTNSIANKIDRHISTAKSEILIAVCWFTHKEIKDLLIQKSLEGLTVKIIVNFDQINFPNGNLSFFDFEETAIEIFGYVKRNLFHHKFILIDRKTILIGSFNFTHSFHLDAMLMDENPVHVQDLLTLFSELIELSVPLFLLHFNQIKISEFIVLKDTQRVQVEYLRMQVIQSKKIWLIPCNTSYFESSSLVAEDSILHLKYKNNKMYFSTLGKFLNKIKKDDLLLLTEKGYFKFMGVFLGDTFIKGKDAYYKQVSLIPFQKNVMANTKGNAIKLYRKSGLELLEKLNIDNP